MLYLINLWAYILTIWTFLMPVKGQYGRLIGNFTSIKNVQGTVYAVNDEVLFIQHLTFNGTKADTFFWAGSSNRSLTTDGRIIPYPKTSFKDSQPLNRTHGNILLHLPTGSKIRDFKWLSISSRHPKEDLAYIHFPCDLDAPKPTILPEFPGSKHGLRSRNITVLDTKTFYIPDLYYDGKGPEAFFWVGTGSQPHTGGTKVTKGITLDRTRRPLCVDVFRRYQGDNITITLPDNLTVYDIDWLAVWSPRDEQNLGHVMVEGIRDVPMALGQNTIPCPSGSSFARIAFFLVPFSLLLCLLEV